MPFQRKPQQRRQAEPTAAEREAFDELLLGEDLEGALAQALDYARALTGKNQELHRRSTRARRPATRPPRSSRS